MADSSAPSGGPHLNPHAPTFNMPSPTKPTRSLALNSSSPTKATSSQQVVTNGQPKSPTKAKRSDPQIASTPSAQSVAEASSGAKLSGAQLKQQKAAEKAARRAGKVAERDQPAQQQPKQQQQEQAPVLAVSRPISNRRMSSGKKDGESFHKRTGSTVLKGLQAKPQTSSATPDVRVSDQKRVAMVSHLYLREKRATLAGAGKEIHPAVLSLGLQLRDFVICGGNARCVAMLLVFKKVIQAYTTPAGVALSRHLTTHLGHQITYLSLARPLSMSQGNSIRWLKKLISTLDPDLAELEAKQFLCQSIDQFIREKVTLADEVIAREASSRIVDKDVILTYSKSSVVEKTLLEAHRQGKKFKVVVVDSRPLFEGRNHARSLIRAGLDVQYCLLSAIADVTDQVTKCFLGASAMLGNGRLSSRAGTAIVAMMAKDAGANIPVIVLCESVKFTGRVALDSIVMNELGDTDSLVEPEKSGTITTVALPAATSSSKGGKKSKEDDGGEEKKQLKGLQGWKDQPNLSLLSLMYDVTPAEYLDMVISELGSLPPNAVPIVNGIFGGDE